MRRSLNGLVAAVKSGLEFDSVFPKQGKDYLVQGRPVKKTADERAKSWYEVSKNIGTAVTFPPTRNFIFLTRILLECDKMPSMGPDYIKESFCSLTKDVKPVLSLPSTQDILSSRMIDICVGAFTTAIWGSIIEKYDD